MLPLRDGLIQRFEFTYEVCHKMLRRCLKEAAASPGEIERLPFADLIRAGTTQRLLRSDWPACRRFPTGRRTETGERECLPRAAAVNQKWRERRLS